MTWGETAIIYQNFFGHTGQKFQACSLIWGKGGAASWDTLLFKGAAPLQFQDNSYKAMETQYL